jgi:isocitrate/isopropylmalate dehydrogenase
VEAAVSAAVAEGVLTPDLGGSATTGQAGAAVVRALGRGGPAA